MEMLTKFSTFGALFYEWLNISELMRSYVLESLQSYFNGVRIALKSARHCIKNGTCALYNSKLILSFKRFAFIAL